MKRTPIQHAARLATVLAIVAGAVAVVGPWFVVADRDEQIARLETHQDAVEAALTDEQQAHDESVAYWRALYEASFATLTTNGDTGTLPSPAEADSDAPAAVAGPRGPAGPAPSAAQVAAAVTEFCAGGNCAGEPSVEEVSAAVAAYCLGGRCMGAAGVAGPAGSTGGVGPAGRGPTVEEIAAAVASYCASGACAGPTGADGANGADGRGIASLVCDETGRWTVTYTDGSSSDAGVCRTDPAPTPTPDPEPSDPPIIDLP